MFIDEVQLKLIAGKGGDGAVSWRREKCIPNGGPFGGNGGKGGDIILEASPHENTLSDFRHLKKIQAEDGERGGTKEMTGRGGEDRIIRVPVGTIVKDVATGEILCDLVHTGQTHLLCRGGRGGYGNAHFTAATRQAPSFAEIGDRGEEYMVHMELKLVADVGIVGLPNAGKSTFISQVTNVRPKIADYPFTTLIPNLGVMDHKGSSLILEDAPGLIEGASEGKGLGLQFLKHLDRARFLLHLVDISYGAEVALEHYHLIRRELELYSADMAAKPEFLVFSKLDTLTQDARDEQIAVLKKSLGDRPHLVFSSLSRENLDTLRDQLVEWHESLSLGEESLSEIVVLASDEVRFDFRSQRDEEIPASLEYLGSGEFRVHGSRIEQIVRMTPMANRQAIERVWDILEKIKILTKVEARIAAEISIDPTEVKIYIGDEVFEFEQVRFRKSFRG